MKATKAVKVRITSRHLDWLKENEYKVNTAVNIAVERWVYIEQHDRGARYAITDVSSRTWRRRYDQGTRHTSIRLNKQLYEYIDMRGYVLARVIYHALNTLRHDIDNDELSEDTLAEMRKGNNGKRSGYLNSTHRKAAEPTEEGEGRI